MKLENIIMNLCKNAINNIAMIIIATIAVGHSFMDFLAITLAFSIAPMIVSKFPIINKKQKTN